jgi:hypothetical protein
MEDENGEGKEDEELLYLTSYLKDLWPYNDIRELNKKKFKLSELSSKII